MNYTALYSTLYRVCGLTRTVTKALIRLFGVQLLMLYGLAAIADTPLTNLADPGLHSATTLTTSTFAPRVFDAVLVRTSARYRRI